VGKSALARQIAKFVGVKSYIIYLSHKADNEVHGQPVVAKDTCHLLGRDYTVVEQAPPKYVIEALSPPKVGFKKGAILVFEELTTVQPVIAAPALAIFAEKRIAELQLPTTEVGIMACANPSAWAVGGWDLAPPSARRFRHFKFELNPLTWAENFPGNWGEPVDIGCWDFKLEHDEILRDRSVVAAYIHTNPAVLFHMPTEHAKRTGCWMEDEVVHVGGMCNPAAWEGVSKTLTVARKMGLSDGDLQESLIGDIGHEAAMQFLVWKDQMDLPTPAETLNRPSKVSEIKPNRSDQLYYLVVGCVERVKHMIRMHEEQPTDQLRRKEAEQAWKACWEVVARMTIGPLDGTPYSKALQDVRSGRRRMIGPKDIGAIGARYLAETTQDGPKKFKNAPVHEVDEIDIFPSILTSAGISWATEKKKR
jgi:hypothetical protein